MATQKISTTVITTVTTDDAMQSIHPELTVIEGQVFCTSLQLADHFDKEHKHVVRDIEEQVAKVKAGRHAGSEAQMFQMGEYTLTNNFGHKVKKPMYLLNRDGFMKLVMGYNGQKASDTQMDYIAAFNKMEAKLLARCAKPETITGAQYQEIRRFIDGVADRTLISGSTSHAMWNKIRFETNAETAAKIPAEQYATALKTAKAMHTRYYDEAMPFLIEMFTIVIRDHVCGGAPLTSEISKEWKNKMHCVLPKPLNWKRAAQTLGVAA